MKNSKSPVVLVIMDGWGSSYEVEHNAIAKASTPHWDSLLSSCPNSLLDASEHFVGLPKGQMGNSEVGHMTIGSGRVILQDLPRIDEEISSGQLLGKSVIKNAIRLLKSEAGTMHIAGLLSDGGVHSHQNHIAAMAKIFSDNDVPVKLHAFLDGRDTNPKSAGKYLKKWNEDFANDKNVEIATVSGRYYAMDRDKKWDRIEKAYKALMYAEGKEYDSPIQALEDSYNEGVFDEFVVPSIIGDYEGMKSGDGFLMCNFRSDRARQIMQAIADENFNEFLAADIDFSSVISMTEYSDELKKWVDPIFSPEKMNNVLAEILAENNKTQLHIAETEKYAHVTFFFNGGREEPFSGEERILVNSPDVSTYDKKPEMSAYEVTDKLEGAINSKDYDFILVNYANTDMVGHTGNMQAAIHAVEAVDQCLGRLVDAVDNVGGVMILTADHGNAETMFDSKSESPHTAHTLNKVPFVLYSANGSVKSVKDGKLSDIAPSVLHLLDMQKPEEMTGESLIGMAL